MATRDTEWIYNGKREHYDCAPCTWGGTFHKLQTFDKNKAEEYLKLAKENCREYDKMSQARTDPNYIRYWQTDIRIQTREVTEWE